MNNLNLFKLDVCCILLGGKIVFLLGLNSYAYWRVGIPFTLLPYSSVWSVKTRVGFRATSS